jgi:hypothetical protein
LFRLFYKICVLFSVAGSVTIDDIEYDLDKLSVEAKNQLVSLQFVDQELQKLNAQAAVLQTARMAYAEALKEALPKKGLSFN